MESLIEEVNQNINNGKYIHKIMSDFETSFQSSYQSISQSDYNIFNNYKHASQNSYDSTIIMSDDDIKKFLDNVIL